MKRKDLLQNLLSVDSSPTADTRPHSSGRVASGAVRAMGLELNRLTQEADQAATLRRQIVSGEAVVDLDPSAVEPSFVADRLAGNADVDFRQLVESMRESGQQVPILVRPHPDRPDTYQIAFGHRRRDAASELGIPVKAVVRPLSDQELVVAQGKENAERRDLSFIERALFASALERRGFTRATMNMALGVQTSEMTRLLSVAGSVPDNIVQAIGPAPKAGRPRWLELTKLLERAEALAAAKATVSEKSYAGLSSDHRFEALIKRLRTVASDSEPIVFHTERGEIAVRVDRFSRTLRLSVDERVCPGLGARLLALLPGLLVDDPSS